MERITLLAKGMNFPCLSHGEGKQAGLLLHGLFDDAGSMQPLMIRLAREGFRTLAPYMPGYGGNAAADVCECAMSDLERDTVALVREFCDREALLVGHDWGGLVAYAAASMEPRLFSHVVLLGIPPAEILLRNLATHFSQIRKSWYRFFFRLPFIAESTVQRNDFRVIEDLWRDWNPDWHPPASRLAEVKATFRAPGTVESTVACCRHLLSLASVRKAKSREGRRLLMRKPGLPTLVLAGRQDGCFGLSLFEGLERWLQGRSRFEVIEGAGHFMHLIRPERVAERILEFVGCLESSAQTEWGRLRQTAAGTHRKRVTVASRR